MDVGFILSKQLHVVSKMSRVSLIHESAQPFMNNIKLNVLMNLLSDSHCEEHKVHTVLPHAYEDGFSVFLLLLRGPITTRSLNNTTIKQSFRQKKI